MLSMLLMILILSENIKSINQIALSEKDGTIDLFLSGKSNLSTLIGNMGDNFNKSKVKVNCLKYKTFVSETDTEVIVNLLEYNFEQSSENNNLTLVEKISNVIKSLVIYH